MKYAIFIILSLILSCTRQVPLYLPTTVNGYIVQYSNFTISYYENHEQPEWVAYELTKEELKGTISRTDDYRPDENLKTGSATLEDYRHPGYGRGHLAPAGDMKFSSKAMYESFYLTNMSPQINQFNGGIWLQLDEKVREWAKENEKLIVIPGPDFKDNIKAIGLNEVTVSGYFYKVTLDNTEPEIKTIALLLTHKECGEELLEFVISIDSLEEVTGIDFFHKMELTFQDSLEKGIIFKGWYQTIFTQKPVKKQLFLKKSFQYVSNLHKKTQQVFDLLGFNFLELVAGTGLEPATFGL